MSAGTPMEYLQDCVANGTMKKAILFESPNGCPSAEFEAVSTAEALTS